MERVEGRVPADDPPFTETGWVLCLSPDDRDRLADNGLRELVRLHALDVDELGLRFLERPELGHTPLEQELAFYARYCRWAADGDTHPLIESAFAWLSRSRPAEHGPVVLSWGDARIGNMMFADDLSVAGVFDWEMASLARPELDLGWWLFMHRHHTEGVADIEYYETLAALRGSVIMVRLARMMIDAGLVPAGSGMAHNNGASRILADLPGLAAPEGAGVALIGKR